MHEAPCPMSHSCLPSRVRFRSIFIRVALTLSQKGTEVHLMYANYVSIVATEHICTKRVLFLIHSSGALILWSHLPLRDPCALRGCRLLTFTKPTAVSDVFKTNALTHDVFFNCEGDAGSVTIGSGSNVQDDAVLGSGDVSVGEGVTIGHGAIIKVCMLCSA